MPLRWGGSRSRAVGTIVGALVLVATTLLARPALASTAGTGSLSGVVTFGATPLAGVNVWIYRSPGPQWVGAAKTDASGTYQLPALAPGTYRLQAWSPAGAIPAYPTTWYPGADGFSAASDVSVTTATAAVADINMARTATVTGVVTDGGTGAALAGVDAVLARPDGSQLLGATTDAGGRYAFADVAPGSYRLGFTDPSGAHPAGAIWRDQAELADGTPLEAVAGFVLTADQRLYTAADQPAPSFTGYAAGPTVSVIGDSITETSTHEIHQLLDPIADASVRGISGQRVDQLQPLAQKMSALTPSQVVIALGTNDELQGRPLADTEAAFEAMLALFPSSTCVHLVTVADRSSSPAFNADVDALDTWLRGRASTDPRMDVVDWQHAIETYVASGSADGPWLSDEIHPSAAGQYALAGLMRNAVTSCATAPGSFTGSVFNDHGADGARDPGDEPLGGVTFELRGDDLLGNAVTREAVSGPDGVFTFGGLRGGTYTVDETVPDGYGFPHVVIGTGGGRATATAAAGVTVGTGTNESGYAWAQPPAPSSIGGAVFADLDGDGLRAPDEPGVGGVTLQLDGTDGYGATIHVVTTTAADGSWIIPSVNPGTYSIAELPPNGFTAGAVQAGSFGGVVGSRSVVGLVVTPAGTALGYLFAEQPVPASQWATVATSPTAALARSVALDADDHAFVGGEYIGSATFGAVPSTTTITSAGSAAGYLARYDADGTLAWVDNISATGFAEVQKVTVDASGNVDVVGDFDGTLTLGSGASTVTMSGSQDALVASFTSTGALRWARALGGASRAIGMGIASDAAGAVFAVGVFSHALIVDSGSSSTATMLSGTDGLNGFAISYDSNGAIRWARVLQSSIGLIAFDVAADGHGGAVIVGSHAGYDFDAVHSATGSGSADVFAAAVDKTGTVTWARSFAGHGVDLGLGVAVDVASGSVFVTGSFGSTVDFGNGFVLTSAGAGDAFVAALDGGGGTRWVRQSGGASNDLAIRVSVGSGHVHVAGMTTGAATFGSVSINGGGNGGGDGSGGGDGFVASYDVGGGLEWVRPIAGAGWDTAWEAATASNGDAVVVGGFSGPAAVMPGPVERALTGGTSSAFVTRLNA